MDDWFHIYRDRGPTRRVITISFAAMVEGDTPLRTDLRVKCGDFIFEVHKSILFSRSAFFEKAFNGPWRESQTKTIELVEDNAAAVEQMLCYLYASDYDDCFWDPINHQLLNIDVYSLADKYFISGLKNHAFGKFYRRKEADWVSGLPEIIRAIYSATPQSDRRLRDFLVEVWLAGFGDFDPNAEEYRRVMEEVPDAHIDVLRENLSRKEVTIQELNGSVDNANEVAEDLRTEKRRLASQLVSLRMDKVNTQTQLNSMTSIKNILETSVSKLNSDITTLGYQVDRLQHQVRTVKEENRQHDEKIRTQSSAILAKDSTIRKLTSDIQKLSSKLQRSEDQVKELQVQNATAALIPAAVKEENKWLDSERRKFVAENLKLRADNALASRIPAAVEKENERLQSEVQKLLSEKTKLEEENKRLRSQALRAEASTAAGKQELEDLVKGINDWHICSRCIKPCRVIVDRDNYPTQLRCQKCKGVVHTTPDRRRPEQSNRQLKSWRGFFPRSLTLQR